MTSVAGRSPVDRAAESGLGRRPIRSNHGCRSRSGPRPDPVGPSIPTAVPWRQARRSAKHGLQRIRQIGVVPVDEVPGESHRLDGLPPSPGAVQNAGEFEREAEFRRVDPRRVDRRPEQVAASVRRPGIAQCSREFGIDEGTVVVVRRLVAGAHQQRDRRLRRPPRQGGRRAPPQRRDDPRIGLGFGGLKLRRHLFDRMRRRPRACAPPACAPRRAALRSGRRRPLRGPEGERNPEGAAREDRVAGECIGDGHDRVG